MAEDSQTEKVKPEKKASKKDFIFATGRRRAAVARIRLYTVATNIPWSENAKKGDILVNGKPIEEYFSGEVSKARYSEPFKVTNTLGKYITTIRVVGGGPQGQLEAVIHGISRALNTLEPQSYHGILRKRGFLTRDARVRQRRKVGMGGKSRREKQSPKR